MVVLRHFLPDGRRSFQKRRCANGVASAIDLFREWNWVRQRPHRPADRQLCLSALRCSGCPPRRGHVRAAVCRRERHAADLPWAQRPDGIRHAERLRSRRHGLLHRPPSRSAGFASELAGASQIAAGREPGVVARPPAGRMPMLTTTAARVRYAFVRVSTRRKRRPGCKVKACRSGSSASCAASGSPACGPPRSGRPPPWAIGYGLARPGSIASARRSIALRLFEWWFCRDAGAPRLLDTGGAIAGGGAAAISMGRPRQSRLLTTDGAPGPAAGTRGGPPCRRAIASSRDRPCIGPTAPAAHRCATANPPPPTSARAGTSSSRERRCRRWRRPRSARS